MLRQIQPADRTSDAKIPSTDLTPWRLSIFDMNIQHAGHANIFMFPMLEVEFDPAINTNTGPRRRTVRARARAGGCCFPGEILREVVGPQIGYVAYLTIGTSTSTCTSTSVPASIPINVNVNLSADLIFPIAPKKTPRHEPPLPRKASLVT